MAELIKCKECGTTTGLELSPYKLAYDEVLPPCVMEAYLDLAAAKGKDVWDYKPAQRHDKEAAEAARKVL